MTKKCAVCGGPAHRSIGGVLLCVEHAVIVDDHVEAIRDNGGAVDVAKIAHRLRNPETPANFAPSSNDVLTYLRANNITGGQASRMMYLSGSNQVRKYTGGAKPRQMDGARWFCLHAHNILSPEQIAQIEAAMLADLGG